MCWECQPEVSQGQERFKFTVSPSFIHALFMSTPVSISHPVSSSQPSTFIITLTFSLPLCLPFVRLHFSVWWTLLPFSHLGLLLSTSLSPAFCLSKGRLLVPYQTLMNYERPLSTGLDRNTSHCLPGSLLKQLRKGNYCNPAKKHLVLQSSGMNYLSCCDPHPPPKPLRDAHRSPIHLSNMSPDTPWVLTQEEPCQH